MRKNNATERQIAFLKAFDIEPPTTKSACWKLIDFIKNNNGFGAGTPGERAAQFKDMQEKYVGKKILQRHGKEALVTSVMPKDVRQVLTEKRIHGSGQQLGPFLVRYVFEEGGKKKSGSGSVSYIKLLE